MAEGFRYKFSVLGRYRTALAQNEPHVTVNLIAGEGEHLTYCGTLTMSESQWNFLVDALKQSLGEGVEVDDTRHS